MAAGDNAQRSRPTAIGPLLAERPAAWQSPIGDADPEAAVICVAPDGAVVSWNDAAELLYGYTRAEIIGRHIEVLSPAERRDENDRLRDALQLGLRIDAFDTVRLTREGRQIAVRMTLAPLHDDGGTLVGFVGVTRLLARDADATADPRSDLEAHLLGAAVALRERVAEGERLAGRLLTAQDEERRRLGRDLHDGVGQLLVVLGLNMARLGALCADAPPTVADTIADSRALLDQCAREVRTLAYLLHPPTLDETGLSSALRGYLDGFAKRSGMAVESDVARRFARLDPAADTALFRVLQECLSNIVRHSGARTVRVRLAREASVVVLEVADDGRGFRPPAPFAPLAGLTGVGIPGMRERLRHLGGQLRIDSGRHGTTIRASLPRRARSARR